MINDLMNSVKKAVKYWWISLLIGVLGIVAGICCIVTPVSSLIAITNVFIILLMLGGIFDIVFAVSNRKYMDGWGWSLAGGILELLLGILLLATPLPLVTNILVYMIGFWILFRSVMGIGESCELQRYGVKGWGWLLAFSILSLLFSFIFFMSPLFGGVFLTIYVGISFLFYGIYRIALAFELKRIGKDMKE
ncbi:MAG: DUF308 domain-containing protein [Tannerella sp.]|jgi:uncharacterized membrane protein HdeD (DUF308 family)|nr:DUF308 domain-containing protein [Tannerella sp.]